MPYLLQGGLGMGDQAPYLATDAAAEAKRAENRAYLRDLFQLAGFPEAGPRCPLAHDWPIARPFPALAAVRANSQSSRSLGAYLCNPNK